MAVHTPSRHRSIYVMKPPENIVTAVVQEFLVETPSEQTEDVYCEKQAQRVDSSRMYACPRALKRRIYTLADACVNVWRDDVGMCSCQIRGRQTQLYCTYVLATGICHTALSCQLSRSLFLSQIALLTAASRAKLLAADTPNTILELITERYWKSAETLFFILCFRPVLK